MKEINWIPFEEQYEIAISNFAHKILNYKSIKNESHYFKSSLLRNRSIRKKAENKVGPYPPEIGNSDIVQK